MAKKILGLDLGTNSIGWSLIEQEVEKGEGKILGLGSRIIPMDEAKKNDFGKGASISQTADRTGYRSARRLRERHLLRRERLHRVLNVLGFLPKHYAAEIDFEKKLGKFLIDKEPKIAWKRNEDGQFEFVFQNSFAEMAKEFEGKKIPYDWTLYYLRKKALESKIEKEELAWLLLNFNQKRGYYQLRGEEAEENENKLVEFYSLKVINVSKDEQKGKKDESWYSLELENGWVYRRSSKTPLFDWKDKVRDFIVTTELNSDKTIKKDKDGIEKRSFRAPGEDDWTLLKKKTEQDIENSNKTVGEYIYVSLLKNQNQKIKGKLVRTVERKFYKKELREILKKQIELQPELFASDKYNNCIRELYRNNESHQITLGKRDFVHLFLDDIIFYQRPLRSQKHSIANCGLEYREFKINGETKKEYLKTIPKSNPLYQEFRIWQWIKNLSIYDKIDDKNVTANFVDSIEENEKLFEFLNSRKKIDQKSLLKYLIDQKLPKLKSKELNAEIEKYRWNFVEDKEYPCNETRNVIASRLEKVSNISSNFLTQDIEQHLWHIIYSITDKIDYEKALKSFAKKHNLDQASFVENFKKIPPFDSEYGAYSEKAIKKLLPLLRIGKYWSWEKIDSKTKERIEKMLTGEFDDFIKTQVREKAIHLTKENQFQGLPLWLASYIIYDRHSEAESISQWKSVNELEHYLKEFKQHSLRNPIVEQVITETLRVVKDIWKKYGNGTQGFFDEIHIELGREMKQTAEQRKSDTNKITENENTNLRIKALIMELRDNSDNKLVVDNVRPYSPTQQEALKIYEDGVLNSNIEIPEDILKISKSAQPTKNELTRYKLWLEQKYRSPYTGESIPLSKLFTSDYEIEHIIPQSRYFDDSFNNKVICESVVNKQKDNQLGLEFIKHHSGEILTSNFGKKIKILTEEEYVSFVKEHYSKNHRKRNNLLLEDIPDKMIERQLNDTRYISKFIMSLLSNIVRENINDDGINSKNIIPCNGKITSQLKQDWGLNDVWNELILPRFERLNTLTNSQSFTSKNSNGKIIPTVPFELSKGFQKKRIDHRHHALDALVIACTTRDHVNLLNNQSAKSDTKRYDLQHKLRNKEKWKDSNNNEREKFTTFKKPWVKFTEEAKNRLEKVVVSIKQNIRVINKATNFYEKIEDGKKIKVAQKGVNWAIRKQMHEATVSGIVNLPWVKLGKGEITTATRERNDLVSIFKDITTKEKAESKIKKITDTGIQKILLNYLDSKGNKPELAFSPEGIEELNNDIAKFNKGKFHQPIFKVRLYEKGSGRFKLGVKGNKKYKFVQGAPNLFFGIYFDEDGNRSFETISLDKVIERQKQYLSPVPEKKVIEVKMKNNKEILELKLENYLSPDDCIYVPTDDEKENIHKIDFNNLTNEQLNRIFSVNDFSGSTCYFRPNRIAKAIAPKEIDMNFDEEKHKLTGSFDIKTASFEGISIKERCIKLKVDRLGNISLA